MIYCLISVQRPHDSRNGAPSGPLTELQLIRSNDLLYLGARKDAKANGVDSHGEKIPDGETKVPQDVRVTVDDSDSVVKNTDEPSEREVIDSEKDPMLPVGEKDNRNANSDENSQETDSAPGKLSDRESTLLEEMEKYLESNNVPVEDVK